jgi:NAD(P)-dependent dehydrogenase (short-subunit alcohol dehydrogenase family)
MALDCEPSSPEHHAGTAIVKQFLDLDENDFWNMMRINVFSIFCVSQAVIPRIIKRGGGSIVCTALVLGELATPNEILYCVSKAACEMFARGIAVEFWGKNIRCNSVNPGFVDAPDGQREIRELPAIGVNGSAA